MALTADQQSQRRGKLTASAIKVLMEGDPKAVHDLWSMLVGNGSYVEPDLSDIWAVQFGSYTEPFHLDWLQRKNGPIVRRGEVVTHHNGWASATLDGWIADQEIVVEAKCVGGFEKREIVVQRYQPQCHWLMDMTGTKHIALSLIEGAREPVIEMVEHNPEYDAELWRRAEAFMLCVHDLRPPVEMPPVLPPVVTHKEYNMGSSNSWVSNAAIWSLNKTAAKDFDAAAKALREAVPADAYRCYSPGIEIKRDRAGRLTIKETK
jgi:hypothetical protein